MTSCELSQPQLSQLERCEEEREATWLLSVAVVPLWSPFGIVQECPSKCHMCPSKPHIDELLPSVLAMCGLGVFAWSVDMKEASAR